jgi:hypothetical protein
MRQSFLLLCDMLIRGGLAVECAGPAGVGRVRLTLQSDGTTFLRCTESHAVAVDVVASAMTELGARIDKAFTLVAATRTLLDLLVLGVTILSATVALLSAGRGWEEVWRPMLVFAAYAAIVPLRKPLLRLMLRWTLRLVLATGKMA